MTDQPTPPPASAISMRCPHCNARPFNRCQTDRGWAYPKVLHAARIRAFEAIQGGDR